MNIPAISSAIPQISNSVTTSEAGGVSISAGSFGDVVRNAINSVDKSQKAAETEIAKTVAGESNDLHRTIIALQSADVSFQLAMAVRNKVVNAFEEIMRMQV